MKFDFRRHVASLLRWAGPKIGFGSYSEDSEELELFEAKEVRSRQVENGNGQSSKRQEVFSSFKYEKRRGDSVLACEA